MRVRVATLAGMTTTGRGTQAVVYGGAPLFTLALVNAVQTGEVAGLGYATDGIKATFGVGDGLIGLMPTAASLLGIPAVLLIGPLADRVKRTHLIAWLMVAWALALGLAATATAFATLFLFRMVVGALESNGPAAISLLADYYPVEKRSRTMSRYQLGGAAGGLFGLGVGALVDLGGWRVAFWAWAPVGLLIAALLFSMKDPTRGEQDVAMGAAMLDLAETTPVKAAVLAALPAPTRVGTCDYRALDNRAMLRELLHIRSMWFGVISITISQLLLNATGFWAPEYFKRFHHLSNSGAAGLIGLLGMGSLAGILVGGIIADRRLAKGHINSRIEMIVIGTFGATLMTAPAYVIHDLRISTPLFVLGGFFFTLPIGPAEAMLADVVPAELRGRATSIRSVVRAASSVGPAIVGGLSQLVGLAPALALFTPLYALGGLYVLKARHTYGPDLAYVLAEANRTGGDSARLPR
jgi:MFS family permease